MAADRAGRRWAGEVFVSVGGASYLGPVADTSLHAHHALQACIALDAPLRVCTESDPSGRSVDAVLIGSDVPHRIDGGGARCVLIYIEPTGRDGRRILARAANAAPVAVLPDSLRDRVRAICTGAHDGTRALHADLVAVLRSDLPAAGEIDERIARALEAMRDDPERYGSLPDLARQVGLSPSRFRALFRSELGISAQRYLVWQRLVGAVAALGDGVSLTDAAHAAGFADQAHLSRAFRRMFGIKPSDIMGAVRMLAA